jgi:hypothetical protein
MTSLLPRSTVGPTRSKDAGPGPASRRPLPLLAGLGGVAAAAATLVVCLGVGVVGWFLTDAGAHGTPRDGLRVGALAWLVAHGSGVSVRGVVLTAVPLGLSLVAAWATWRVAHRVGEAVSGHGPDADAISDGQRDWTVPAATLSFAGGYALTAAVTAVVAGTAATAPSVPRVVLWSLLLCLTLAGPAIAIGSGRAAIWATYLPATLRAAVRTARHVLLGFLGVSALVFVVALVADLGGAATVLSQLHASGGEATLIVLLSTAVLPNAVAFTGSFLLGPGFAVGVQTVVSPAAVVIGPLPLFPLLAALPSTGPTPSWSVGVLLVPALVAALATARAQRRSPTLRWDEGAVRGCAGGVLAGVLFALLAALARGAVGPGRMQEVGPFAFDVLVHAITAFGIGGLLGGLVMTAWLRRAARREVAAQ